MPRALRPVRDRTRLDQLLDDLRRHSSIEILDLRPPLMRAKLGQRVSHKTDTFWNDAGALVASQEILARIKTWFPDLDSAPTQGLLKTRVAPGGDLARVLALEDQFPEERIEWQPTVSRRAIEVAARETQRRAVTIMECKE